MKGSVSVRFCDDKMRFTSLVLTAMLRLSPSQTNPALMSRALMTIMRILKKILVMLVVLIVLVVSGVVIASMIWPRINDVATGETAEYPDLQPQEFKQPYYRVFDAALGVARELGWEVETEDRGNGAFHAVATTALLRFRDDVTVTFKADGSHIIVNVRSRSRIGKGDLGANARRIRRFQQELLKRL